MNLMDIMDVRAKKAFSEMLRLGFLQTLEPGDTDGSRLYRSTGNSVTDSLTRDERIVLHQARWPHTSTEIIHKASGKYRLSNQVRWESGISGTKGASL